MRREAWGWGARTSMFRSRCARPASCSVSTTERPGTFRARQMPSQPQPAPISSREQKRAIERRPKSGKADQASATLKRQGARRYVKNNSWHSPGPTRSRARGLQSVQGAAFAAAESQPLLRAGGRSAQTSGGPLRTPLGMESSVPASGTTLRVRQRRALDYLRADLPGDGFNDGKLAAIISDDA